VGEKLTNQLFNPLKDLEVIEYPIRGGERGCSAVVERLPSIHRALGLMGGGEHRNDGRDKLLEEKNIHDFSGNGQEFS
jgi:hypothetical protein